jgi:hypothetical protein
MDGCKVLVAILDQTNQKNHAYVPESSYRFYDDLRAFGFILIIQGDDDP